MMFRKRVVFAFGLLFVLLLMFSFGSAHHLVISGSRVVDEPADNGEIEKTNNIQDKSNNLLSQNISFPGFLDGMARFAFGLKQSKPTGLSEFVVLVCLWLVLLIVIKEIMVFFPFFEEKWIQWAGAIVITLLAGFSGGLQVVYSFFFSLAGFIEPFRKWKVLQLVISILILGIFFLGTSKVLKILKNMMEVAKAKEKGRKIAEGVKSAEVLKEGIKEISGK